MASELFASDCPLYCICHLGGEEFCATGGGGEAKTGVPNLLEVYRLSHDGLHFLAKRVHRHSWDTQLVMDASRHPREPHTLAAGVGDSCQLLSIKTEEKKEAEPHSEAELKVSLLRSVQTDFDKEEPYQKVVRFSHDGSLVVTGGTDGVVRCWKYPTLKKCHELTGHKTEIETLACHPHELQAVSACRHGDAVVWDLEKGKKEAEFTWSPDSGSQKKTYRFRACCFSPKKEESPAHFFSINIPLKWRARQKQACYIVKWDADSWQPIRSQKTGSELLSALAVDPTGNWLGVGTGDGSVAVYNSNLNLIKKVSKVHTVFVTDLAFVTAASQTVKVKKPAKTANATQPGRTVLLSVSADKLCCVTDLKRRGYFGTDNVTLILIPVLVLLIAMVIRMLSGSHVFSL